ncbi:MAG: D-aminoacylase [Gemmatimonadetes bacterium]|nr:D-aminoacylase [Gemmatimonadota bacterium]
MKRGRIGPLTRLVSVISVFAFVVPVQARGQPAYDVILRGGRLLDGTGNPWLYADVAVTGERIVAVGDLSRAAARRVVDVRGLYVAPGFIDVHSHSGEGLTTRELSEARALLAQGLTTVTVNPDGGGPVDLVAQRAELLKDGLGVNVVQLVPHGSVRSEVLGMQDRAPTPQELDRMRGLVRAGMEAGGFGLSSGLFYAPGSYAKLEEVIELAKVAAEYGGVYTSHIRDESDYSIGLVASVDEVIGVAREARLPGIVTHIKALGPRVWGYSGALVKRIERAREQGIEVFADQYPYTASATGLEAALVPRWAEVGGREALLKRMSDASVRRRLLADMRENLDRRGGAARIQFRRYQPDPAIEGKTLEDVARARGLDPIDAALELIEGGEPGIVSFNMDEDDVRLLMRQPWVATCTDGDLVPMGEGVPHPRSYGAFVRKIQKYVVEDGVIDLAMAVRSMTHLPATVFRLRDRGLIREGATADIVVFDLARVRERGTYQQPHQLAEGMVHVLVNGQFAVEAGRFTGAKDGRVLNRKSG